MTATYNKLMCDSLFVFQHSGLRMYNRVWFIIWTCLYSIRMVLILCEIKNMNGVFVLLRLTWSVVHLTPRRNSASITSFAPTMTAPSMGVKPYTWINVLATQRAKTCKTHFFPKHIEMHRVASNDAKRDNCVLMPNSSYQLTK